MASQKKAFDSSLAKSSPDFRHLQALTTKIGIIQHAKFAKPNLKFGYSLDDNARALIVAVHAFTLFRDKKFLKLAQIYLNYIKKMQKPSGLFHNFLSSNSKFLDSVGSQDSFGRTIWALGYTIYSDINSNLTQKAKKIFNKASPHLEDLLFLRSQSYTILGLSCFLKTSKNQKLKLILENLAQKLILAFKENSSPRWLWFENKLTYSNAVIPLALFSAFEILKKSLYFKIAKKSFDFLLTTCQFQKYPSVIGQRGWYQKGGKKALFDQQPVDAALMVFGCLKVYQILKQKKYLQKALWWFSWFWGNNISQQIMIAKKTGGCYDGLERKGKNQNQGAESCLVFLLAHLSLFEIIKREKL